MRNVVIIGAGGIAQSHAKGWLATQSRSQIVGVVDIDLSRAQRMLRQYGWEKAIAFKTLEELFHSDIDVDIVDICTPDEWHHQLSIMAMEHDAHVICEKPMCQTLAEAQDIQHVLEQHPHVQYMPAHNQLFLPVVEYAEQWLAAGKIGDVLRGWAQYAYYHDYNFIPLTDAPPQRFGWRKHMLRDYGYHALYILVHLLNATPATVYAELSNDTFCELEDDSAEGIITFTNGTKASFSASYAWRRPGYLFSLAGTLGTMWSVDQPGHMELHFRSPRETEYSSEYVALPKVDTYEREITHFLDHLDGLVELRPTISESISALAIALGAEQASRTHSRISIEM